MRIKTLVSLTVALFALSLPLLQAQSSSKHELGLQFSGFSSSNLSSFNAIYRKQKSENVYRRIRFTAGNISVFDRNDNTSLSFGAGIFIGREKRRALDNKLEFYRGPEVSFGLSFVAGDVDDERVFVNAGFGYVLGVQHSFSELWAIHLETVPRISANLSAGDFTENDSFGISANFSSAVSLGIVRKF